MRQIFLALALTWLTLLGTLAPVALAQTSQDVSEVQTEAYQRWLATAQRAEEAVNAARASNAAFEALREELVTFREGFATARDQNSTRIRTLQSQLNALGPKPDTGDEPSDIAFLRNSLSTQLDQLRVPRIVAEEAFNRANGLISEVDRIIRDRQARKLLSREASPLNPVIWPNAFREVLQAVDSMINETRIVSQAETTRVRLRSNLPLIVLLGAVGLVLLVRGNHWAMRLGERLRALGGRGTGVWSFLVSLMRIFLPLGGLLAVVQAVSLSGMLGLRADLLLTAVPGWGLQLLLFVWLGEQFFATRDDQGNPTISVARLAEIRLYVWLLALMEIVLDVIRLLEQIENISDETRAVIGFAPIAFTGLILLRFQRVALRPRRAPTEPADEAAAPRKIAFLGLIPILRRLVVAVGVLAPILAGLGYGVAAEAVIYPTVRTLALFGAILIIQRFLTDVYAWLTATPDSARDSLFSVLVGFTLVLFALPILALIWGGRVADLTEVWSRFLDGFQIGGSRISPLDFMTFAAIFAVGYMATRLLQSGLRNNLLPKTRMDAGGQNAIVSGTGYIGIFLAALIAITGAGLDLSSLAIVAGALSVGIGFGLQTIVSNFVSGIILLVERPISKGDWIEVGGQMGYVRDISVRSTRIETFDRTDVIVPNSDLISGRVTNYTRGNTIGRIIVPVGVAYGTDTRQVETILREIAEAHPMVLANPAPNVVFQGFGADSLDFEIRAILRDINWALSVKSDMNHEIARRFVEEGIEIPFAQRDIWIRNPEALPGASPKGEPT